MPRDLELREALAEQLVERDDPAGDEAMPSEEELIAYLEGELPVDREERLQDHLARNPDEVERLLALAELLEVEVPSVAHTSPRVAAELRDLEARLEGREGAGLETARRRRLGLWASLGSAAAALAASLAFWVLGTSATRMELVGDARLPVDEGVERGVGESAVWDSAGPGKLAQLTPGTAENAHLAEGETLYLELPVSQESGRCEAHVFAPEGRLGPIDLEARSFLLFLAVKRPALGQYRISTLCGTDEAAFAVQVERLGDG